MSSSSAQVRKLNDAFRLRGPTAGTWVVTAGVAALGTDVVEQAIRAVAAFDSFDADNDPHREHDFGSVSISGETLFWKIDYYDVDLRFGSADPADENITRRVLTIMLASEY